MHEWLGKSASEISQGIHQRKLRCVDLMEQSLEHICRLNPSFNAIVSLRDDNTLLEEARQCDQEIENGHSRGWMHGIPQAIKDLAATKDVATTKGSPIFANHRPAQDGLMVQRMRTAGAIVIGKTNTPEFGLGSQTYNPIFGSTANAWDRSRTSGGSSGGAAVALALRMLCVADGSDMGGSLRNPAGWNHVFGLRPSQHLVPKWPATDGFFSQLGTEGPMARHAIDLARLLATQIGRDPRVPLSIRGDTSQLDQLHAVSPHKPVSTHELRIGWLGDLEGHLSTEEGVLDGCQLALNRLQRLGAQVSCASLRFDPESLWLAWIRLRSATVSVDLEPLYDKPETKEQLKPEARWEVELAKSLSGSQLMKASVERTAFYQTWLSYFQDFDFLALPTAQVHPFSLDQPWVRSINGRSMDTYHRWMETVIYATMAGSPALSMPAAFWDAAAGQVRESATSSSKEALSPVGIQLIAAPQDDFKLISLAHRYEIAHQDFMRAKPPALCES